MNNRWKTFLIVAILVLKIFLTAIDTDDTPPKTTTTPKTDTPKAPDSIITVDDKEINLTEFFNNPKVKALREISGVRFQGTWNIQTPMDSPTFDDFQSLNGVVKMGFLNYVSSLNEWRTYGVSSNATLKIMIIDGSYLDDKLYLIEFSEAIYRAFNIETGDFSVKDKRVNLTEFTKFDQEKVQECDINMNLNFGNIIEKGSNSTDVPLEIVSEECQFTLKAVLQKEKIDREKKTINYSIFLTFLAIVNLYAIAKMIKQCIDTPSKASQLSLLTIGFLMIWDTYICLSHLYLALSNETLFHFFIMPTFWYFILFSIFEMKLLIIVWRTKYWNTLQTQEQTRKAMVQFYLKLYVGMVVLLVLFYKFALYNWFIFLMSLYLLPQIIHNAMRGGRVEFDPNYMFIIIGLRALLPLYCRGCPENIIQLRPSISFCCAVVLLIAAQIVIIYHQSTHGSKFFIPARFLPIQYNYLENLPEDIESGVEFDDCAVCMCPLHHSPDSPAVANQHTKMVLNRLKPNQNQIMKTPCNHKFHVFCLLKWMEIKMECPTCRAPLPVLE